MQHCSTSSGCRPELFQTVGPSTTSLRSVEFAKTFNESHTAHVIRLMYPGRWPPPNRSRPRPGTTALQTHEDRRSVVRARGKIPPNADKKQHASVQLGCPDDEQATSNPLRNNLHFGRPNSVSLGSTPSSNHHKPQHF